MGTEYRFFEEQQSEDLLASLRLYATVHLQRAERCRRLWERAHATVLNAVSDKSSDHPLSGKV